MSSPNTPEQDAELARVAKISRRYAAGAIIATGVLVASTLFSLFAICKIYTGFQDEYENAVKECVGKTPSQCPQLGEYYWTDELHYSEFSWNRLENGTYILRTEILDAARFLKIENGKIVGPIEEAEADAYIEEFRRKSSQGQSK